MRKLKVEFYPKMWNKERRKRKNGTKDRIVFRNDRETGGVNETGQLKGILRRSKSGFSASFAFPGSQRHDPGCPIFTMVPLCHSSFTLLFVIISETPSIRKRKSSFKARPWNNVLPQSRSLFPLSKNLNRPFLLWRSTRQEIAPLHLIDL